ncbi:MAG: hypothetical protein V2B14_03525 [bacterium]
MKKIFFFISIILIIYFITVIYNNADWDLWARFAVGAIFFNAGAILKHDIFAYTPTKNIWIDHEWGSGVIFYFVSHYFGDIGLLALKFFILLFIFILVFKINQLRSVSNNENPYRIVYYLLFFYGILSAFDNTIRSQSFTYLLFALWLYLLDLVKLGNNRLIWIFPITMIIWANMHGGFLAGLGIVCLFGIGEALNKRSFLKYFGILAISIPATLINPYGITYWSFIIDAVTMHRPFVSEWDPLNLFGPIKIALGFKIFLILTILSFIYMFIKHFKKINWAEILILGITFYFSLKHVRHIIFFILASGSYIYYYLYPVIDGIYSVFPINLRTMSKKLGEFTIYGSILFFGLLIIFFVPLKIDVNKKMFPTNAVRFIQQNNLSGNLLVLFNWGSYALWKLYPQCLITIDGRYEEIYPKYVVDEVARFHYTGVNWDDLLKKYHTDMILIPLTYDNLYEKLLWKKEWKLVYKDDLAAIFIPKSKNKPNWVKPDSNFDANKEKYKSNLNF